MRDAAIDQDLGEHLPVFATNLFLQRVSSQNTILIWCIGHLDQCFLQLVVIWPEGSDKEEMKEERGTQSVHFPYQNSLCVSIFFVINSKEIHEHQASQKRKN